MTPNSLRLESARLRWLVCGALGIRCAKSLLLASLLEPFGLCFNQPNHGLRGLGQFVPGQLPDAAPLLLNRLLAVPGFLRRYRPLEALRQKLFESPSKPPRVWCNPHLCSYTNQPGSPSKKRGASVCWTGQNQASQPWDSAPRGSSPGIPKGTHALLCNNVTLDAQSNA